MLIVPRGASSSARHFRALRTKTLLLYGSRVFFASRSHVIAIARYSSALASMRYATPTQTSLDRLTADRSDRNHKSAHSNYSAW